eukprot:TRINITY_DN7819_c0_g1_i1.p1 TRINITY_DN7819_c0_g1~~TRINITY_DN7819_c0_g1_i1.p1  ORF type:complete len:189 (+),score=50.16 TRINITY_DN7819_c0_g1_i1:105-671(+)
MERDKISAWASPHSSSSSSCGGSGIEGIPPLMITTTTTTTTTMEIPTKQVPPSLAMTPTTSSSSSLGLNAKGNGNATKPRKKRSRASKKPVTTLVRTDPANFRAMVQQFTGAPQSLIPPPSSLPPLHPHSHPSFPFDVGMEMGPLFSSQNDCGSLQQLKTLQQLALLQQQRHTQNHQHHPSLPVYSQI